MQQEKKINWLLLGWTGFLVIAWALVFLALVGCAKPDYDRILAVHTQTVLAKESIARAVAEADHQMVRISFAQETLLPAGTTIETWYDWTHAIRYPDTAHNPATEAFRAEAQRDGVVFRAAISGAVAGVLGWKALDTVETIARTSGGTTLTADNNSNVNLSGGVGDRTAVSSSTITESLDTSDNTHPPTVVTPATSTGSLSQEGSASWQVQ